MGDVFDWCPETVPVPAGTFLMGSPDSENGRLPVEGPQRLVSFERPFAVGKFTVTVAQFTAFITESGYRLSATCQQWNGTAWQEVARANGDVGFSRGGDHPAVCVNWYDAQAYAAWLSHKTQAQFRLLSEAEWEYAARANTATPYWWGTSINREANYNIVRANDCEHADNQGRLRTMPVGSFRPNPWGLHQMHGNVWEWVEDCWCPHYLFAPVDGSPQRGPPGSKRVLRGGSWLNGPRGVRSGRRHAAEPGFCRSDVGIRLARTLD